ncbi:signal peptidase I [Psychrobacillus sp. BL-248-WT-3]|uniref:signal peptidase I n=1 Tax=Psychrobacillus sp. BL-248-WT-3 TaxID=2725306 RepID=UPI00146AB782|nr:signal peptidase I [Psychrobacillus sp. BL-248-WT-3]NME05191.1 signal peptidase I [Psychrobacillus sp. BL-248-WT-3]
MTLRKTKEKNELFEWIKTIGIALLFAFGIRFFLFEPIVVDGASMMPTFENGDKVVVNKIGPELIDYQRFDVIVFEAKEDTNYIKRIIGIPGDRIAYENDELFINGERYEEPYLEEYKKALLDNDTLTGDFTLEEKLGETTVPDGTFFVLGDNRRDSTDSRDPRVGFVSEEKILGTAKIVFLPLDNLKIIK